MQQLVIMPGGFHPFHAGHFDLYQQAQRAFPNAEVYVAATNDTSERPFPFALKEKLAKLAGVEPGHFVQVKSPFQAQEITSRFDPNATQLIFVRSTKDQNKPPQPGGVKKNGELAYLQPYTDDATAPMSQHGYMTYLPTVEFGPGMTSATEIRNAWPQLNQRQRTALIMSMYPAARANPKLADTVVKMLDTVIVQENQGWAATYEEVLSPLSEYTTANTQGSGAGMTASYQRRENQPMDEEYDYIEEKWSQQYKRSINCNNPQGFSQKAHCAGRKK
jgi:cytidyltransferase-like protein